MAAETAMNNEFKWVSYFAGEHRKGIITGEELVRMMLAAYLAGHSIENKSRCRYHEFHVVVRNRAGMLVEEFLRDK